MCRQSPKLKRSEAIELMYEHLQQDVFQVAPTEDQKGKIIQLLMNGLDTREAFARVMHATPTKTKETA